jgi:diphosphomevalonate decarboxylase
MTTATAQAFANIAFVKYWGDRDASLHLPANGSISMNLDGLTTHTRVTFDPALAQDELLLDGARILGQGLDRVSSFLDRVRQMSGVDDYAQVDSQNNFPAGAGLASSASAFAALSLAASAAAGLKFNEQELSRLARRGSGSACRSVPGGFVEWQAGNSDEDSYGFSIAPPEHWSLVDCIAILSREHKTTGSNEGHVLAAGSPLQAGRLAQVPSLLAECRRAILGRDFDALALVTELDCHLMHAVMMTSSPPLIYWLPGTLAIAQEVQAWRKAGLPVCYTIDAGPNVHVICESSSDSEVVRRLSQIPGVEQVLSARPGGAAHLDEG